MTSRRLTSWSWLGRIGYSEANELQVRSREALRRGEGPERLLLLEHPPVFTLGRNAGQTDLLWSPEELERNGVEVHESDRGGQVTYHGPGQLVGYPVLNLDPDRRDLRRYVADLQQTLVDTLADFGVRAQGGERERIGVWTSGRKIASIGIHLSRWITTHGFALNVDPDLGHFAGIVACGMPQVEITSIARETGVRPELEQVARRYCEHFARRFDRDLAEAA
ncbi:MAG: lipoyl(octanoyl) transferase LipB [Thermoanaerobaculia bacterium]